MRTGNTVSAMPATRSTPPGTPAPGCWPIGRIDYVTALGDDLYSQQIVDFIAGNGIGIGHIQRIDGKRPGLYLIHQAGGDRHFTYWRGQSAAKLMAEQPGALISHGRFE